MKKRDRSRKSFRLDPLEHLETRALLTMTAISQLPDMNVALGAVPAALNLDSYLKDPNATADFAIVDTSLGTIPVLLTPKTAPAAVSNFLNYVNKGAYTNTLVDRSVPGSLWQAGGFKVDSNSNITPIAENAPIKDEFAASNVRGTIAMAKVAGDPNGATSRFFFDESDSNAATLDHQDGGSTVFGHVVGSQGPAVMDAIGSIPVPSSSPLAPPLDQAPLQYYTAGKPLQAYNLTMINGITTAKEYYESAVDNPGVATVTIQQGQLTVDPVSLGTAHVAVVGYGSDGSSAVESFTVNVEGTAPPSNQPPAPAIPQPSPDGGTPLTPVAPGSALIPSAEGGLPASVVAGHKTKIQQTVTLSNPSTTFLQSEKVTLSLSETGANADYQVASATTLVKLKIGSQARLTLSANHIGAAVPAGVYHLLVSVTDPDGPETTTDTGKTLIVQAPQSKTAGK